MALQVAMETPVFRVRPVFVSGKPGWREGTGAWDVHSSLRRGPEPPES